MEDLINTSNELGMKLESFDESEIERLVVRLLFILDGVFKFYYLSNNKFFIGNLVLLTVTDFDSFVELFDKFPYIKEEWR